MSLKLQITVTDEIGEELKKEAEARQIRLLTYAAIVLTDAVLERKKRGHFDDGF
jgi:hypothetical protein